jgi:hypothetical protein
MLFFLPLFCQICRPNSGRATMEMRKDALLRMYHRVSAKDIRAAWSDLYELTLNHCTHGPKCKLGAHCEHGRRIRHISILGGHTHEITANKSVPKSLLCALR